jgi:glycosyltransferase involved in cell wall biosynthesis
MSTTVLMVTYGVPYPPDGGSRIRNLNTSRWLARRHSVILVSLAWDPDEARHLPVLRQHCEHVDMVLNHRSRAARVAALAGGCLAGRPLGVSPYYFPAMAEKIRDIVARRRPDLAIFDQIYVAPYVDAVPADGSCRRVLSLHDVASGQYRSMLRIQPSVLRKGRQFLRWRLMARMERRYLERFDHCVVVSAREARLVRRQHPALPISVIENGVDTSTVRPLAEPPHGHGVLFVGDMQYLPNADGVRYFVDAVFPLVRSAVPDAKLYLVGHRPPRGPSDHVLTTGRIPDSTPYYEAAQVVIAPLRAGGGTRLKILEAMAHGRPVVSTSIGCQGLHARDREHLLIADTPSTFANGVIELLKSAELRARLGGNGRRLVEAHYDWSIINRKLTALYDEPRRVSPPEGIE